MASGKSPYERSTYRYSPLIAFLLMPNSFLHQSWGKFLFSASVMNCLDMYWIVYHSFNDNQTLMYHTPMTDLLVGLLIHRILKLRGVPEKLCTYSTMLVLIFRFALDLPFCFFLQTLAFVAFNKVITAQYFVWFFCLLPLILPWSNMKLKWKGFACISLWIGAQTHWLMWGYLLEFRGKNVFFQLWLASLLFLAANTFVIINVIHSHVYCPLFKQLQANSSKGNLESSDAIKKSIMLGLEDCGPSLSATESYNSHDIFPGFEAGGQNIPSNISPWSIIGDESSIVVSTDRSSCFDRNKVALQMEVLCNTNGDNICPAGGVGVYNPGFWGMNIEQGKTYKVTIYIRSLQPIEISVSFIGSNGLQTLATADIKDDDVTSWTKKEILLEANGTDRNSRLQLTTRKKCTIWLDQVSAMPLSTHKGHGFRQDLFDMLAALKPGFIRFPGGSFVEGNWLVNAFRWRETIGKWEERPGHFGDVWQYWTDDGLGYFEYLQLAEDLGASPVWVFNNGISRNDQVDTSIILPFVQDILDALEFAKGDPTSKWGSIRAAMGHVEPFDLRYVAVGNQDCFNKNYHGNYMKFYSAIKGAYPDIKIISNCDGSVRPLDHPADLYDFHAFVSEYAVTGNDAGRGSLLKALAEADLNFFLSCSDVVEMASNAPLFENDNDRRFNPDAIVFDSSKVYGTPSYWMQHFFKESNGATLLNSKLQTNSSTSIITSAISWENQEDNKSYLRIKVLNFGGNRVNLKVSFNGLDQNSIEAEGSAMTTLTSNNVMDENSFNEPKKVAPVVSPLENASSKMNVMLLPYSLTSIDLLRKSNVIQLPGSYDVHTSL
ncbi:hypothetical protein DH2020_039106 [Rehmannia glutinosa]|uniref:non-reducing end alpha-L-arabinofuranosidase n=1 Tax=Rehmannia glutinosa TaxID=99300 RepID=A0ABR0UXW6_REHGL